MRFVAELFNWIKARKYRNNLAGRPYFWGQPDSRFGSERYEAFLTASGLKRQNEEARLSSMSKIFDRFASYAITPFKVLGWKHSLGWGLTLGFVSGILISVVVNFLWTLK